MNNTIKTKDRFENGWLKEEYLWELRKQINLNSIYFADYRNSFGIDEHKVYYFFDGYMSFLTQLEKKKYGKELDSASAFFDEFDNEGNLRSWYGCFDYYEGESPLPPPVMNVDIYWTFHRSVQVIAANEGEAREIVDAMMERGEIPRSTFTPGDDCWELDATYQS